MDIEQLQQVIDKVAETLRKCPEDASPVDLNEIINEGFGAVTKVFRAIKKAHGNGLF